VVVSGSVALLGDTLHNIVDALTAVPLLVAFRLARRPANTRYTDSYGGAEDLAGLFVVVMIALSRRVLAGYAGHRSAPEFLARLPTCGRARSPAMIGFRRKRDGRWLPHPRRPPDRLRRIDCRWTPCPSRRSNKPRPCCWALHGVLLVGWAWADPVVGLVITTAILRRAPLSGQPNRPNG
jgi:hypothetical protein